MAIPVVKRMSNRVLASLIMVIAGSFRIYQSGSEIWLDEALSYHFVTTRSFSNLLFSLPLIDPHPPLYYIILKGWIQFAGSSEFALRLPSIVFGTLAVGMFYYLVEAVFDRPTALLASILMSISPFFITYSQEVRMYALSVLLTVSATYFLYRATNSTSVTHYTGYIISSILLGYTHVWGILILGSHVVYTSVVLARGWNKGNTTRFQSWIVTYTTIGVLLSPWIGALLWRAFFTTSSALDHLSPPSIRTLLGTPVTWVTGVGVHPSLILSVPIAVFAGVIWLIDTSSSINYISETRLSGMPLIGDILKEDTTGSGPVGTVFAILLLLPLITGIILSYLVRPMYEIRTTILVAIGFYALLARGITLLPNHVRFGDFASVICSIILVLGLVAPLPMYYNQGIEEPWGEVTDSIQSSADEDDLILITDQYMQSIYAYYGNNSSVTILTIAEDPDRDIGIRPKYPSVPANEIQRVASKYDTIWLVSSHVSQDHTISIQSQINSTHYESNSRTISSVELFRYRAPSNTTR